MADTRAVTPAFAVAPQIDANDMAEIAAAGFKTVINNRPDGEASGQMTDLEARRAAETAGLDYVAIPISGGPRPDQIDATSAALAEAKGPVLAYCRSGTRSITTWALSQAAERARPAEEIVELAAEAGYDLRGLAPVLARLAGG